MRLLSPPLCHCVAIKSIHLLVQFAFYLCIKYPGNWHLHSNSHRHIHSTGCWLCLHWTCRFNSIDGAPPAGCTMRRSTNTNDGEQIPHIAPNKPDMWGHTHPPHPPHQSRSGQTPCKVHLLSNYPTEDSRLRLPSAGYFRQQVNNLTKRWSLSRLDR